MAFCRATDVSQAHPILCTTPARGQVISELLTWSIASLCLSVHPAGGMAIAGLLLLLWLVWGSVGEDAEVVCAGTACYTLHRAELGWNGAQERCRHNGGNLAPVRDRGEAERLRELLVAASWLGPAWIGLSLSRGQCTQPQEPLRGFAWAAGGEPGNYSAWLSEPAVTCLSSRCVSLRLAGPGGTIGWADRPCRAPLPAFLCKFSFRGMCGPLPLAGPRLAAGGGFAWHPPGPLWGWWGDAVCSTWFCMSWGSLRSGS
uniref:C-type lectin domain-containing protein n=1 Tax=Otus sunia TaxID=257818 RepID=A0A8C8AUU8_9STRI